MANKANSADHLRTILEEIETRFWSIVDRDGLSGLPSDMWAALDILVKDRAERQRAERNRDMWKGQCQRQTETLTLQAQTLGELHAEITRLNGGEA